MVIRVGSINTFAAMVVNNFADKHAEQIIRIAPRHEPLETPIEDPKKTKHETGYGRTYYDTEIKERVDTSMK